MSRKSRRRRDARNAAAMNNVQQANLVPNSQMNQLQNMQPSMSNMSPLQNMQQPQYIPPVAGQSLQTSPMSKSQQKIANAKFPALRSWWEGLKSGIGGTPESVEQYSTVSPQQQSILEFLQLLGAYGLGNPYEEFQPIAEQAQNEFNQQVVPSLAERFTSVGKGAISSPAFASQLGQAGAGLQQNLAALRSDYGMQNRNQALQMLQLGLNPYTENIYRPAQPGLFKQAASAAAQALPALLI